MIKFARWRRFVTCALLWKSKLLYFALLSNSPITNWRERETQTERDALVLELYQSALHLDDWEEFSRLMNSTFNNIVCTLMISCPDIKRTDIIWCCLHLLDLSQAERIIVLNVSTDSLYKIKQRLALKLHLKGAKMLDEYLKQFKNILIS